MTHENWSCPRCGHDEFEVDEVRTEGGMLSAVFDVSTRSFTAVICARCHYAELYRTSANKLQSVFDFFVT